MLLHNVPYWWQLAEHIAYVAHTRGVARVVSRPRQETERLTRQGHALAQLNGFPLTFSPEAYEQLYRQRLGRLTPCPPNRGRVLAIC